MPTLTKVALLSQRFSQTVGVRIIRAEQVLFSRKYLFWTNITLSMGFACAGDAMQQAVKRARGKVAAHDYVRTKNMTLAAISMGIICHNWYLMLDRYLPGYTIRVVVKKVVLDQVILSPVMWAAYFSFLSLLQGKLSWRHFADNMLQRGGRIYAMEWVVWPPAQVLNFYLLPTRFRVLYDNLVSLGFDWYTSYIVNDLEIDD